MNLSIFLPTERDGTETSAARPIHAYVTTRVEIAHGRATSAAVASVIAYELRERVGLDAAEPPTRTTFALTDDETRRVCAAAVEAANEALDAEAARVAEVFADERDERPSLAEQLDAA